MNRKLIVAPVVFVGLALIYPLLLPDSYHLGIGITAGTIAVSTVGIVLLLGFAHQLALGQAAFSMIGGYATAILTLTYHWDPLSAMVVGALATMVLAYVIGAPILKLRGFVLAMATLALHLMLIVIAVQLPITGGSMGLNGIPKFSLFGWRFESELSLYYLIWFCVFVSVAIGLNIEFSRIGRALRAISASEDAAGSVGIDISRYKLQMFVIGAGMASVSGSLVMHYIRSIDPTVFGFNYSINLITGTIVGGLLSIWGGALGAVLIVGLRELLRYLELPLFEAMIMGGLTVVVLIVFRRGVSGCISDAYDRLFGKTTLGRPAIVEPGRVIPQGFPGRSEIGNTLLEVKGASRSFGNLKAVDSVNLRVREGSITALIGPNGAGKTTLFNLIGGYQPMDSGTVTFDSKQIEALLPQQIAELGIGRTFQNLQLFDNMTVLDNVMCGRHRLLSSTIWTVCLRLPKVRKEELESRKAARDALAFVGLDHAEGLEPGELSFGHQRMVEIARSLALRPRLLLMDEPASGLNDTETERLAELIMRIAALGVTVLLVEHDMRLVMGLADQLVVMDHGEKMADGPTDQVRNDPRVIAAYLGQEVMTPPEEQSVR